MNNKEILENVELHRKDRDGANSGRRRLVLVTLLAALIAAVAGAVYGAFRLGRKRGARDEAKRAEEKRRAERERRSPEAGYAPARAPRPVYVVHPLPSKKRESRTKRFKRHLCAAVAAILVISMVGSGTMSYITPATALAKESFSGIGKIVEEHGEEPYRILDIVPADAMYYDTTPPRGAGAAGELKSSNSFTLGTMGYLVNGQSALQADLAAAFKTDLAGEEPNYGTYEARKELFDKVVNASGPFAMTYEEVYGGIGGVSTAGYTPIYGDAAAIMTVNAEENGFKPLVADGNEDENSGGGDGMTGGSTGDGVTGDNGNGDGDTTVDGVTGDNGNGDGDTTDGNTDDGDGDTTVDGVTGDSEDGDGDTTGDGTTEDGGDGGNGIGNMMLGTPRPIAKSETKTITSGEFHAKITKVAKGEGDYSESTNATGFRLMNVGPGAYAIPLYTYGGHGAAMHVTFKPAGISTGVESGYVVNVLGTMGDNGHRGDYATDMTGVYYYHEDDGTFTYAGTVAQLIGRTYTLQAGSESGGSRTETGGNSGNKENSGNSGAAPNGQTGDGEPAGNGNEGQPGSGELTGDGTEGQPENGGSAGNGTEGQPGNSGSTGNGTEGQTGNSESTGDGTEGQPTNGDPANNGGEGQSGNGDSQNNGGQNESGNGGGRPEGSENENNGGVTPTGNDEGDGMTARAILPDGWYLLAAQDAGEPESSDDSGEGGGDMGTPESNADGGDGGEGDDVGTPDNSNDHADGSEGGGDMGTPESNADGGDGGEGDDTETPDNSNDNVGGDTGTPSYVMSGPSDEEIDWSQYESLMICSFTYAEHPEAGVQLYEVDTVEEVIDAPGLPMPWDAYNMPGDSAAANYGADMIGARLAAPAAFMGGILLTRLPGTSLPNCYTYTPGEGEYQLTYSNDKGDPLITIENAPIYIRCRSNNDWLKQYVFSSLDDGDNESDDFDIEVTTLRADQVSAQDVQKADLVFLESANSNPVLNISAMGLTYIGAEEEGGYRDMPEAAVIQILREAAEDLKPVIVDYDIVDSGEHYKDSNYQYLARALLKQDLAEFIKTMDDEKGNLLENVKLNVKDSDDFPVKDDNKYNYVNQNIYVVNGSTPLVSDDFHDRFEKDDERAGFSDVVTAIRAENTTLSEDDRIGEWVSKARAMQYIINFSVGILGDFSRLAILEIQPSANRKSDFIIPEDDKTKLLWKRDSMKTAKQILFSRDAIDAQIDPKSVAEFNGEWEDINGVYDVVFIGLDGQRLNLDDEGRTLYNNSDLNGKVYHTGDESGAGTYDANDLTGQKMDDLLHYMAAGYPVLVENDCFEGGSAQKADGDDVNTDYIQEGSVMYNFLRAAVSDDRYEDCIFTIADAMANSMFMTRVRLSKPRIELVDENGEAAPATQHLEPDENGEYHGQLYYRIKDNRGEDYFGDAAVHVYADYNHDGAFVESEEVTEYLNENNMLDVKIDGMGPGILPWKIEVADVGNEYRRASVQGCFELGSETADEFKVLQITEKKNDMAADLQLIFNKKKDSVLAHYLKGAESILDVEMQIESVNAGQLEKRLAENGSYLQQWDVVVLTLDGAIENGAVAEAVNRYAGEGRSLIVCGQDPGEQRGGLSAELLGQTEGKTFVHLGGSTYHRYAGLDSGMYEPKTLLKAEPVNEGSIASYPYVMDEGGFTFGEEGVLRAAPYLLDFDDNLSSEVNASHVTAWYTFGSGGVDSSPYDISPRDARNNYYCYSKGNVVYLAQSEYPYTCDEQSGPDDTAAGSAECRFFVNALFAAYSAGLHNAHINIVGGFSQDAADITSISVPFDQTWTTADLAVKDAVPDVDGGILGDTVDVYFKFRDNNLAAEKTVLVGFYYEDPMGGAEVDVGGEKVSATPFGSEVWTVTDNRLVQMTAGEELQPGKIYRIKAPVVALRDTAALTVATDPLEQERANRADIYIVLETSFVRGGKEYRIISSDSVALNRTRLFLLE